MKCYYQSQSSKLDYRASSVVEPVITMLKVVGLVIAPKQGKQGATVLVSHRCD